MRKTKNIIDESPGKPGLFFAIDDACGMAGPRNTRKVTKHLASQEKGTRIAQMDTDDA